MASTTKVFGASVLRKEDDRFLMGRGRFVADMLPPGTVYAKFVRSPYAHARIRGINTAKARRLPGVLDILTAQDLKDQVGDIITAWNIPNSSCDGVRMPNPNNRSRNRRNPIWRVFS